MKCASQFACFFFDMIKSRKLIFELTKKDLQTRYLGSYLGVLWAFIQPTVTILIFWFVFEVGFKSMPVANYPFILWLLPGMITWFFISDSISGATNSILESSYLVKKVVFRVSILPVVKILSALLIHLFFLIVLFLIFLSYGYQPTIYYLQIIYYLFAANVLILGLSWLTSALIVFLRDMGQFVAMVLQFLFWLTPIFWSLDTIPVRYKSILMLNPIYYIIAGYRDCFIYHKWFWDSPILTIYYWTVALGFFVVGAIVFRRLRPHFADIL